VNIYNGFKALREKGHPVDAVAPQAAIYLTLKIDLRGKTANGKFLETQSDVTSYLLDEAKLAIVPFYAFGAGKQSPWYRLSVGTCSLGEIGEMFTKLEAALQKAS
jgi:aspartate aminotransferase